MKKMLRAFLGWLDRKFPDRVELTMAEYLTLKAQLEICNQLLVKYDEWTKKTAERLTKIESEIANLNVSLGLNKITEKFKLGAFQR